MAINFENITPVAKCSTGCCAGDVEAEKDCNSAFHKTADGGNGDVRAEACCEKHLFV